ncbi:DEAD/DEAH box helicase family protein [archaeon]|nr:DEAD/DEAH box helicase family protein [archaeon]
MSKIILKPFQENAIAELRNQFLTLWKSNNRKTELILKSPTGSGKTIMMAQFLRDLTGDPQFDADKCFLWFSFNEPSYLQSKNKLLNYYGGAGELNLLDLIDLANKKKLEKNNIFFINWQKLKSSTKEGRKLRNPTEYTEGDDGQFDELIKKTQKDGREIILIVDEAHRDTDTNLADELINLIDPKIILKVTATPKAIPNALEIQMKTKGFVNVTREDVVEAELIKEKIITQTKEDLENVKKKEIDQDILLLDLAYNKREELLKKYKDFELDINPLALIQLPNDDISTKETLDQTKMELVKNYLREKGVPGHKVAIWLAGPKENLEDIEENDSEVDFLIFKQAAATGWDCPRASILVMFREIRNPVFHTQTVGRVLRMPEARFYSEQELNKAYLYTNYERNQVRENWGKLGTNKPFIYTSKRKKGITPIKLESTYMSRPNYNDLGDSFQNIFEKIANKHFEIEKGDSPAVVKKKLEQKGLSFDSLNIDNNMIVDAEIENFDNFIQELVDHGTDLNRETSKNDLIRTYNMRCFDILAKQEDEKRRFAPARSWGKLKTALNVWIKKASKEDRDNYYKLIVKDLLKLDSELVKIISDALLKYRPIREEEVHQKASRSKGTTLLDIPNEILEYNEDYEEIKKGVNRCSMKPFYLQKEYLGKINETRFIKYLEGKDNVEWWHKNGDEGSDYFAIPYYDHNKHRERLFYPDWIIKLKNGITLIVDTKKGKTASENETKWKAEALQEWIKKQKNKTLIGGIVVEFSNIWKINSKDTYNYEDSGKEFEFLDKFF